MVAVIAVLIIDIVIIRSGYKVIGCKYNRYYSGGIFSILFRRYGVGDNTTKRIHGRLDVGLCGCVLGALGATGSVELRITGRSWGVYQDGV